MCELEFDFFREIPRIIIVRVSTVVWFMGMGGISPPGGLSYALVLVQENTIPTRMCLSAIFLVENMYIMLQPKEQATIGAFRDTNNSQGVNIPTYMSRSTIK